MKRLGISLNRAQRFVDLFYEKTLIALSLLLALTGCKTEKKTALEFEEVVLIIRPGRDATIFQSSN